jgi:hypothetical protein
MPFASTIGKIASGGWKTTTFAARQSFGLLKTASKVGMSASQVGMFAFRHPYMTLGAVGTGAYLSSDLYKSPYSSPSLDRVSMNTRFNDEQMAANALNEAGIAPMGSIVSGATVRNQKLMESTNGLTQGLWRSRH